MFLLGFDIGSSSVKVAMLNASNGKTVASAFYPKQEMKINALQPEWAEQDPETWWENLKLAVREVMLSTNISATEIEAIGISYQMHGLVLVDKAQKVLRPSIIWCDSRASTIGNKAFKELGEEKCLQNLLNSPGNFTASKLKWVQENEPEIFAKIDKIMLPGDYISMKLSGKINTTISGLSEGIFWNFKENKLADFLLDYYGFDAKLIPETVPTFSVQAEVSQKAAEELGLRAGIKIAYRAGDQPNNALSLNVLNPGEVAATAGTSGVIYGVSDKTNYDPKSRVNTFAHVNYTADINNLGILLCINGTGILNSWMKKFIGNKPIDYAEMNELAAQISIGSEGLCILPFGNGAERVLENNNPGASVHGLNFNIHNQAHIYRAGQEGIAFSFNYGFELMKNLGIEAKVIRAGNANMFLSPIFRETLAGITGACIELYNTDGATGAARGAGIGSGIFASAKEAFANLNVLETVNPNPATTEKYRNAYFHWKNQLDKIN